MDRTEDEGKRIKKYILGELSEEDTLRVEERILNDEEYYEQVLALEDELFDDYVRGELPPSERESFERRFLNSPQWRERLDFAQDLLRAAPPPSAAGAPTTASVRLEPTSWWSAFQTFLHSRQPAVRFARALAIVVVVAISSMVLIAGRIRLDRQLFRFQAERQRLEQKNETLQGQIRQQKSRLDDLEQQLRDAREAGAAVKPNSPQTTLSWTLLLTLLPPERVESKPELLTIPPGDHWVPVLINLGERAEFKTYRADLRTVRGEWIETKDRLPVQTSPLEPETKVIFLLLSSRLFHTGEYIIDLKGLTARGGQKLVGEHHFKVLKQ